MERDHPPGEIDPNRTPTLDDGSDEAEIQRAIEAIRAEQAPAPIDSSE
jgi:hypothetical protein